MKRFLFFLFITTPLLSLAQSNFRKGYIVTNSNDTLKGYINYKERAYNPSSVQFKDTEDSQHRVFDLKNCSAYAINDLDVFQRFAVNVSGSKLNVADLSIGRDSSFRRDTVFLRVLQAGKNVTLYAYKDNIKERFYLKENNNTEPYELVYQIFLDPIYKSNIHEDNRFVRQLLNVMVKYNPESVANDKKLKSLKYNETDLLNIVSAINGQQYTVKSKYSRTRFFAGTGLNISKALYHGTNYLANSEAKSKISYSPFLTAGIDQLANPAIGKLIFRVELSLLMSKNEISTKTDYPGLEALSHTFNQYSAVLVPQIIYNFYNTDLLKVFLGAGFGIHFSEYSNNKSTTYSAYSQQTNTTINQVALKAFTISTPLRAGVVMNKRIEFSAIYMPNSSISDYGSFGVDMQRFSIGLNYLFGK